MIITDGPRTQDLLQEVVDPSLRAEIEKILRRHHDNRGKLRSEVSNQTPSSYKYPVRR